MREKIGVIGAGSWGTTLADLLAKKGHDVTLWAYEPQLAADMAQRRINDLFLPGITLAAGLRYTNTLGEAVSEKNIVLVVSPSQVVRSVLKEAQGSLAKDTLLVSASKGVETGSLLLVSEIYQEVLPDHLHNFTVLSGPSFAREVAQEMPTAVVAAAADPDVAKRVQDVFSTGFFRVYTNNDIIGVELGGAIKNVIAIAAGISDGLGFGSNTRAALITRGLTEISRLGKAMGAQAATFAGLAGMGDLVLTCTGDLSRNRTVGINLGKGRRLADILAEMRMVAEGVKTSESAYQLARKLGVAMPIIEAVYQILYEEKSPRSAVMELMTRDLKAENV